MALTSYMIGQSSDHLTEKHIQLWLLLFKKLPKYKAYAFIYSPLVEGYLNSAKNTIKARMLNALMKEIDELGVGEVSVGSPSKELQGRGDPDGTYWYQTEERLALIEEGLDVLFDDISLLISPAGVGANGVGSYGSGAAVGNRKVEVCCSVCNVIHRECICYAS